MYVLALPMSRVLSDLGTLLCPLNSAWSSPLLFTETVYSLREESLKHQVLERLLTLDWVCFPCYLLSWHMFLHRSIMNFNYTSIYMTISRASVSSIQFQVTGMCSALNFICNS